MSLNIFGGLPLLSVNFLSNPPEKKSPERKTVSLGRISPPYFSGDPVEFRIQSAVTGIWFD